MNTRAKSGGKLGVNGEWYNGGEFLPSSEKTVKAAKRAAELKDKIEDANDAIMAFKGEGTFLATGKALQSVASGFAAAQGAMGLFGSESENVEKAGSTQSSGESWKNLVLQGGITSRLQCLPTLQWGL